MHPLRYVVLLAVLYVVAAAPSPRRRKRPKDEDEVNKATIGDLNRQIEELRAELAEAKSHPDPELSEQPTESPVTRPPKNKRKKNKRRRGPSRSTTVSPIHESDDVLSEDNEPNIHGMRQHPPSHHSHNNNPNTPTATQNRNSGQEFINIGGQFYEDLGAIDDQPGEKNAPRKATISKGRPHPSETIRPLTLDNNEEKTNVNAEGPEETPDALTLEEPSPVTELTFIAPSKMMPKKGTHKSFSKTKGGPNKTKSVPRPILFPEQYEPDNEVTAETLLIKSQSNDNTVRSKWENPGGFPVPDGAEP